MTTSSGARVLVFSPLNAGMRRGLEQVVVRARDVVETGVEKVVAGRLGVGERRSPTGLSDDEKLLRRAVLAKRRQTGSTEAAVEQIAFGIWHRMLFARFLAENKLLMHPELGVPVSLAECQELAEAEGQGDGWMLASRFASDMLPGLFPQDDPLTRLQLLPEDLATLEGLLEGLDREVFTSDDGLGWVYQFWQSKHKDQVNASEVKIGARELPAVTQLFTEHYMVRFLLENSLGSWWAARHPDSPLIQAFDYLRLTDDGQPAAGSFEGWPDTVAEITVMDPCCGSGHFLTSAFEMLWRMRVEEEHLTPPEAQVAVLRDNLFGLELDARCTEIAAFNLALTAWKAGKYRELPTPNVACSGIRVSGSLEDWLKLAGDDARLRDGLEALHAQFKDADTLGSLINPRRASEVDSLMGVDFDQLEPLLDKALAKETTDDPAAAVFGRQASAVAQAATLLANQYTLITTNPPFLHIGRAEDVLRSSLASLYAESKNELATAMYERWSYAEEGSSAAFVLPQNPLFLGSHRAFREKALRMQHWVAAARIGVGGFDSITGEAVNVVLLVSVPGTPKVESNVATVDVGDLGAAEQKARGLRDRALVTMAQSRQANNPESRFVFGDFEDLPFLSDYVTTSAGIQTGDYPRFGRYFWEVPNGTGTWERQQSTVLNTIPYGGRQKVVRWESGRGELHIFVAERLGEFGVGAWLRGTEFRGLNGVAVKLMGDLPVTLFSGTLFDNNVGVVIPNDAADLPALWAFCRSERFPELVRLFNPSMKAEPSAVAKIPFDVGFWRKRAEKDYPNGLPQPYSDDPTQWLLLGDPTDSMHPLQVAVARLLGHSWPDQQPDALDELADRDGIVCLPPVLGEQSAAQRLQHLLIEAFEPDNPTQLINRLLSDEDAESKTLDEWLRDLFFKQHSRLFHNRPFIWHIWDGRRDGFSALVNYHIFDRDTLKRLTNTYLKWWITRQQAAVRDEEPGAEGRLAAALELETNLELILEGEPPYDIYIRWKPLHEQPIGWDPDLNDGVRLNVRPFVEAGILRNKFNVKWGKDRGKNPDGTERHNSLHHTRTQKQQARKEHTT